jgi:hypothetical protein
LNVTGAGGLALALGGGGTSLLLTSAGGTGADFNNNGIVGGADFLIWQRSFPIGSGALQSQGDADGNGTVDAADLALWESGFGAPPLSVVATAAVPEPSALAVALLAGLGLLMKRR